nr:Helix-turn-helix domain protein [uncultured bacterium]
MPDEFQIENNPQPDEKFVVNSLETLKVMADPNRLRILEEMIEGPRTVKQLASALETTPTKLYYHINLLEEHGLIKVISTRVVSGIIEKLYHVSAYQYPIDKSLLSLAESSAEEGFPTIVSSVLDHTATEIRRSIKSGLIDLQSHSKGHRTFMLIRTLSKLSSKKADEFMTRFEELMQEFNDCDEVESPDPDARVYGLTIACYPTHHKNLPSEFKTKGKEEEK